MSDYWDIDDILTTEESVDCVFISRGVGLGHLDPLRASTGSRDVCITFWMSRSSLVTTR